MNTGAVVYFFVLKAQDNPAPIDPTAFVIAVGVFVVMVVAGAWMASR